VSGEPTINEKKESGLLQKRRIFIGLTIVGFSVSLSPLSFTVVASAVSVG
jgi:hypothetical protein